MKRIKELFIVLIALFAACQREAVEKVGPDVIVGAQIVEAQKKELPAEVEVVGTVTYMERAAVSSKIDGRVERVFVKEGQRVKKGQILVTLERLPLVVQLKQAKAELKTAMANLELARAKYIEAVKGVKRQLKVIEKAEAEVKEKKAKYDNMKKIFERKKELFKIGGVSQEEFETAQTNLTTAQTQYLLAQKELALQRVGFRNEDIKDAGYRVPSSKREREKLLIDINTQVEKAQVKVAEAAVESAKARVESIELLLKETVIRSPINGKVGRINIYPGEEVKAKEPFMMIVRLNPIYVEVDVPERDAERIRKGQRAKLVFDALGGKKYSGRVEIVPPLVDPATRTLKVKIILNNSKEELKPGMFARGVIVTDIPVKVVVVPKQAVLTEGDKKFVFVVKNGILFKRDVVVGREMDEFIEIKAGLKQGEKVLANKLDEARDGMRVVGR